MIESARTWMLLRSLRRGSRAEPDAIERRRERALSSALAHAREKVPLYRRLWKGLPLELERLPVIDGGDVRQAFSVGELPARGAAAAGSFPSSGSAGEVLHVPRGTVEARLWRATALRTWFEHGYSWRDRTVHFDAHAAPSHPVHRVGIARTLWISPELETGELVDRFLAARADLVAGTPTAVRRLCRALGEPSHPPRSVFCEGEVLDRGTADLIERAFGVAPVDLYGLTETGFIGWQCERREHLHVNAETCIVELLVDGRPARPGELGSVVVTTLLARTAPMIRYDTGDLAMAVQGPCACGRTLPLMGRVEGRSRDSLGNVTTRKLIDHLAPVALPDGYQVHRANGAYELRAADGAVDAPALAQRLSDLLGGAAVAPAPGLIRHARRRTWWSSRPPSRPRASPAR